MIFTEQTGPQGGNNGPCHKTVPGSTGKTVHSYSLSYGWTGRILGWFVC